MKKITKKPSGILDPYHLAILNLTAEEKLRVIMVCMHRLSKQPNWETDCRLMSDFITSVASIVAPKCAQRALKKILGYEGPADGKN